MRGGGEERKKERRERVWKVGFASEASTKQGAYSSVEGQKEERRERKADFYWQRGIQCVLVKEIKKKNKNGGVLPLLCLHYQASRFYAICRAVCQIVERTGRENHRKKNYEKKCLFFKRN